MKKEEYWFWLCSTPGMYRESIQRILEVYPSPEAVYLADKKELLDAGLITEKQMTDLRKSTENGWFLKEMDRMQKENVRFLCPDSEEYPEKLKMIPEAPYGIYVKGKMPDAGKPSVGMVGARACSEYGRAMTERFSSALAAAGVQIISGMAVGVDSLSAKGALKGGGKTFAVLGGGVDVIYPTSNFALYYEIIASGGGIISEYPMGTQPMAWQFPARNRLISGLSDRLLVMEARERSGTLITVQYALAQGRDVYALPGRLTDKTSESCNRMIADGAGILISPEFLLSEIYGEEASCKLSEHTPVRMKASLRKVYDLLDAEPVSVQYLIEKSRLTPQKTAAVLTELELSGLAREVSKNNYVKLF